MVISPCNLWIKVEEAILQEEVKLMSQPITTNPVLIALINMTVVFCVLYGLSLVVRLIKVIDPTQKKKGSARGI